MQTYARSVYQQAYLYTGDAATADDITQNVFLQAYRHLGAIRDPKAWLNKVTLNAARNMQRARTRHAAEELPDDLAGSGPDPATRYEERAVIEAILGLPAALRQVIALVYYQGLSAHEAATMLGIPEGTVRSRLFRARAMLRQLLEEACEG